MEILQRITDHMNTIKSCCRCRHQDHEPVPGDEDQDIPREAAKASVPMTAFNLTNGIVGSGLIGIPYSIRQAGIGLGLILLVFVGLISDLSLTNLIHAGELSTHTRPTFQNVMTEAFGLAGFILITATQFLYPFLAMVSYNVIIGDTITKLLIRMKGDLEGTVLGYRQVVIVMCTLVVTLPLSLHRDIAKLSKWATLAFSFIVLMVVFVCIRAGTSHLPPTTGAFSFANPGITRALGVMSFAFMCHHLSFLMYESLKEPNSSNWSRVVHTSIGFSLVSMLTIGVAGFVTFTDDTQGDLLENYCQDDDLMNVGRFAFAMVVMFTFPVECFAVREVVENSVFAKCQPVTYRRHLLLTLAIVFFTLLFSFLTDCLGILLEFNGVLTAIPMSYIFPPLLVLKLQKKPLFSATNIPLVLTVAFGVFVTVFGLVVSVTEIAQGVRCSHGRNPPYCVVNGTSDDGFNITLMEAVWNLTDFERPVV